MFEHQNPAMRRGAEAELAFVASRPLSEVVQAMESGLRDEVFLQGSVLSEKPGETVFDGLARYMGSSTEMIAVLEEELSASVTRFEMRRVRPGPPNVRPGAHDR